MSSSSAPFSDRVKNIFGSLNSSSSTNSKPVWSMSDVKVEKREWRRDKDTSARDSNPCSSSFHNNNNDNDDWDIRSSIGLDSTLDNEEEEDTYDKVAIGRENAGDRLYMKDITGHQNSHFGSQDDLSNPSGCNKRDPRANHSAARIRLKEDATEFATQTNQYKGGQSSRAERTSAASEDNDKVKPILKRKENESTSKPSKRVRFDPGFTSSASSAEPINRDNETLLDEKEVSRVPDYIQNPSNYKCYSLDSSDITSDKSNTGALDLVEMAKMSKDAVSGCGLADAPVDLPKSISFIPKKKSDADKMNDVRCESIEDGESCVKRSLLPLTSFVGITPEEDQETEFCEMEVDEHASSSGHDEDTTLSKQGRQYRSKSTTD